MPSLGADMDAGRIVKWLIAPGDRVRRGDVVAEVETEKATIEAEVFETGVVERLLVAEGELVPVGTPLAMIASEGAPAAPAPIAPEIGAPPRRPAPEVSFPAMAGPETATGAEPTVKARRERRGVAPAPSRRRRAAPAVSPPVASHAGRRSSPVARRRASELGVDLTLLRGSGPDGAIVLADVEQAAKVAPVPAPPVLEAPPVAAPEAAATISGLDQQAAMRHAIGALMARSKREIPHYYLETTIDFGRADAFLREVNAERPPTLRILSASLLLKATALAVHDVPQMNGFFVEEAFQASSAVHLGVAISLRQGGLIAPAIHDVDALDLDELTSRLKDLVARVRSGRLRSSEMADATLTVTNLGEQGVEKVFGVIYPPQVALVGFGKILDRLAVVDGLIGIRPLVVATLSADHRVSDGAPGARFLSKIDRLLQQPEAL